MRQQPFKESNKNNPLFPFSSSIYTQVSNYGFLFPGGKLNIGGYLPNSKSW